MYEIFLYDNYKAAVICCCGNYSQRQILSCVINILSHHFIFLSMWKYSRKIGIIFSFLNVLASFL
jgi:hypothetical protein